MIRIFSRHHQNTLYFRTWSLNRWYIKRSWPIKDVHVVSVLLQMFHAPCWGDVRKTMSQIKQFWRQEQPRLHLCLLRALSKSWGRLLRARSLHVHRRTALCMLRKPETPGKQRSSCSFDQGMPASTFSMPAKCSVFWRCIKRMRSLCA